MCGRYTLRSNPKTVAEAFDLADIRALEPRYNIAPTQDVAAIRWKDGKRHLIFLHWGLIPSWADDPSIGNRMINARADGVADKPSFRSAFKKRRCLVVADGFYEWKKDGKSKQPFYVTLKSGKPFAFAGLYEHWRRGDQVIDSCTIITTEPNELMADIHDRMPVILPPADYDFWLDPEYQAKEKLLSMLGPYPVDEMKAVPVGTTVNNPRHESAECVEPLTSLERHEPP